MSKRILVCYLFTDFDKLNNLKNFIVNYKKYPSGVNHKLLICFKLIDKRKIFKLKKYLTKINHILYDDICKINDYDFGSYKRVAISYPNYKILFLNSHSYPICKFWLKKLLFHFKKKTLIGTTASNESMYSSIKLKKIYKFFSFSLRKRWFKEKFYPFPNPHIRTSSFLINSSDFLSFVKNRNFNTKEDAWFAESGKNGMTNFFKKKKFNILIVNSDGLKFEEKNWIKSNTYHNLNQSKLIISDKHTRKYFKQGMSDKLKNFLVWG
mgnify:CR=1 FL=1